MGFLNKNYAEWKITVELMEGLWPNADLTDEQLAVWEKELSPLHQETLRDAMKDNYAGKGWKTPRLADIKASYRLVRDQLSDSAKQPWESVDDGDVDEELIRQSHQHTLDLLMVCDFDVLLPAAKEARRKYGWALSNHDGDDPCKWSIMFRHAVRQEIGEDELRKQVKNQRVDSWLE
ncbi:MAG: hypothetical protein GOVbin2833_11 [Prokaryotic dsDNA virus sp.]|nr:MAG: hypothetical protein GOVbin2833_11 [Prokaryotic dsDNA virus sp.]|tara:strand:- start:17523 stop:18053 length:531 start_codon:yes stop_codon:yes gene_type:complete